MKRLNINKVLLALTISAVATAPAYGMLENLDKAYSWVKENKVKTALAASTLLVLSDYAKGDKFVVEAINEMLQNLGHVVKYPRYFLELLTKIELHTLLNIAKFPAGVIIYSITKFPGTTLLGIGAILAKLGYDQYLSSKPNNDNQEKIVDETKKDENKDDPK